VSVTENGVEQEKIEVGETNGTHGTLTTKATTTKTTTTESEPEPEPEPEWTSLWDFLAKPSPTINPGAIRMKRFGISMDGFARVQPIEEVLDGESRHAFLGKCAYTHAHVRIRSRSFLLFFSAGDHPRLPMGGPPRGHPRRRRWRWRWRVDGGFGGAV
jgi:hypothetical protein